jgi:hypothetical protein
VCVCVCCVCVSVCVRVCVRACARARARACVWQQWHMVDIAPISPHGTTFLLASLVSTAQVLDTEAGSIHCSVDGDTVCSYSVVDAQYDGRPCWMLLASDKTLECTWTGKFSFMGTWGHAVTPKQLVSTASKPECPKVGAGANCSSQNTAATDTWMVITPGTDSYDDVWYTCTVDSTAVCRYRSRFGRIKASSCAFLLPAGATLNCTAGGSGNALPQIASTLAVPLTKAIVGGTATRKWQTLPCPFSGAQYSPNDCACSNNISLTQDALVHLEVASPDATDNSIWCFGSGNEDLCSFTWNGGEGDSGSCSFFLPAGESISCKIQFGTVDVISALWMPLTSPIFGKTSATPQQPPRHWDRLIGHDPARGPVNAHSFMEPVKAAAQWTEFKKAHHKRYHSTAEEAVRFHHFLGSLTQIERLKVTHREARFGINEYSDLSPREWLARSTSLQRPADSPVASRAVTPSTKRAEAEARMPIPPADPVDWREKGAVVPVKNQGTCGNCWAFSAVAAMESHWAIAGNSLVSLSEEFLTDCNYPQSPGGCGGGFDQMAFDFVIKNGIDSEESYPYTSGASGKSSNCTRHWPPTAAIRIEDWVNLPPNETAMAE